MPSRGERAALIALALVLSGCARPAVREVEVGRHRVRFVLPEGWEHLDHGRQQLFRLQESQLTLVDLGPATHRALAREIQGAEAIWLAGRRRDAFQRVREVQASTLLHFSPSQRADFWRPWYDAIYAPEAADSARIGAGFAGLLAGIDRLPPVTPDVMLAHVLRNTDHRRGREITARRTRAINGSDWTVIESWDGVSHMNPSRIAFLVHDGNLLMFAIDRGPFPRVEPGFEALLASLEVTAVPPGVR